MKTPTDEEIPRLLAEAMGWNVINMGHAGSIFASHDKKISTNNEGGFRADIWMEEFKPLTDRNHAHLAVEECARLGLIGLYAKNLQESIGLAMLCTIEHGISKIVTNCLLATPEQISRAAWRTLAEHRQKEGK